MPLVKAERRCLECKKKLQGTPEHYYHAYYCAKCFPGQKCPTCGRVTDVNR